MNPVLRSSAAHIFVESVEHPVPTDDDAHHLLRVLRLRDGETVTVSDGCGRWRPVAVAGTGFVPTGEVSSVPAPAECAIAAAVPKGDRLEWMVQKLTEVGATRIVLLDAARGVVRWDRARGERQLERLARVVREAASQSRRCWLPALVGPCRLTDLLDEPGAVLADPSGTPMADCIPVGPVIIGPEGGFDPAELEVADRSGVGRVAFGDGVLRVETAAVVAAALLVVLRSTPG